MTVGNIGETKRKVWIPEPEDVPLAEPAPAAEPVPEHEPVPA